MPRIPGTILNEASPPPPKPLSNQEITTLTGMVEIEIARLRQEGPDGLIYTTQREVDAEAERLSVIKHKLYDLRRRTRP